MDPDAGPGLDRSELADEAGTSLERIDSLVQAGVLLPSADGKFRAGVAQTVRVMGQLEAAGIPLDVIARGIARGELTFEQFDRFFPSGPSRRSTQTLASLAAELGRGASELARLVAALGVPLPSPDAPIREDEASLLRELMATWGEAPQADMALRLVAVSADGMRRVAASSVDLFDEIINAPLRSLGLSAQESVAAQLPVAQRLTASTERLVMWLYRRHLSSAVAAYVVEQMEIQLAAAGLHATSERVPAIVFVDLTGFTATTERLGDRTAVELAAGLGEDGRQAAERHHGRVVKLLGDGIMLRFDRSVDGVRAALELVEASVGRGLPPAHGGVHAGPVISRDGDEFGRTVNLAARIGDAAGAGEVLVSDAVVEATGSTSDVRFTDAGSRSFHGLTDAVHVHLASRSTERSPAVA